MAKESQKRGSGSRTRTDASRTPNVQLGDLEKREIKDKPHRWIEARVRHLDPAGYMEEINSLRYFGRNAGCFALQIVAIADWGRKYMDVGFRYRIPAFPQFLFSPILESHQGGSQVPAKPSQVHAPGGDVCQKSREAWKWMVAILQFWGDEASTANGVVFGGRECLVSALAEYVLNTINPGLDPGSKITWDDVVTRTPWLTKRLHGMTAAQEMTQAPGSTSSRRVLGARSCLGEKVLRATVAFQRKGEACCRETHRTRSQARHFMPPRLTKAGRGDTLKLHLKRARGEGWSVKTRDLDPSVGHQSQTPQETSKPLESEQTVWPGRSPLTSELLAPDEELTEMLDYEDVEENDLGVPDPEIAQAVAHIPQADAFADVEMQESQPPLGFEPEVSRSGYDVNLVRSDPTEPGSTSPVMAMENQMLDGASSRTLGAGRPGTKEDPGCSEDN